MNSIRVTLTLALLLASYGFSLLVLLSQQLVNLQQPVHHASVAHWFDQHFVQPLQQTAPSLHKAMLTQIYQQHTLAGGMQTVDHQLLALALIDNNGMLLAQLGQPVLQAGDVGSQLPMQARDDLADALTGHYNNGIENLDADQRLIIKPLQLADGSRQGAVLARLRWPEGTFAPSMAHIFTAEVIQPLLWHAVIMTLLLFPAGALVIYLAGYRVRQQLQQLKQVIAHWSEGQFSARIPLRGPDEIVQSFARLNALAEQLPALIADRQELAAVRERNQLAAELHDTVKQQLFANNLTLASCRQLLQAVPGPVAPDINQLLTRAIHTNQKAFCDVGSLVHRLHQPEPAIAPQLQVQHQLLLWQQQTGISVSSELSLQTTEHLPLILKALREALQNIVKHSQATQVRFQLTEHQDGIEFCLEDQGGKLKAANKPQRQSRAGQGLQLLKQQVQNAGGQLYFSMTTNQPAASASRLELWLPIHQPLSRIKHEPL